MAKTSGPDYLREILKPRVSAKWLARKCGVTVAAVYHWGTGLRRPSDKHQKIIDSLAFEIDGIELDWKARGDGE